MLIESTVGSSPAPVQARGDVMERVLIVEEAPGALADWREAEERLRREFEVVFALAGPDAQSRVDAEHFDMVVADVSGPTGPAIDLLRHVMLKAPTCTRLVVSDDGVSLSDGGHALVHRRLQKPCRIDFLLETLRDYVVVDESNEAARVLQVLGLVDGVPSLPAAQRELVGLFSQSDPAALAIARVVESDPGAAMRLLQLVNSSWFALPQRITSVTRAVQFLGLNLVRGSLLLTSAPALGQGLPATELEPIYDHCLFVGQLARDLAPIHDKDTSFTAGLLHDLGKIALLSREPKLYRRLIRASVRDQVPMGELERMEFGVTHAAVGAHLLKIWGLGEEVADAVKAHHRSFPKPGDPRGPAFWVRVADLLVHEREVFRRRPLMDTPPLERIKAWGSDDELEDWRLRAGDVDASR